MVGGWANYKSYFEISWHFVVSMNLRRAIGVHLSLLTCAVDGDPLLDVVVQSGSSIELKVHLWPLFH